MIFVDNMITKFTGDGLFFTSDTHFGHNNILRFGHRPFDNIDDHDNALIQNWNNTVRPNDTVFHLGDFAFGNSKDIQSYVEQLNGHIILIKGNHDDKNIQGAGITKLFEDVLYQARILVDGRTVYLNHFPFLCFAHGDVDLYKGNYDINLFGHVHSGPRCTTADKNRLQYLLPTQYDVGVDNNDFKPISWFEITQIINRQIYLYEQSKQS